MFQGLGPLFSLLGGGFFAARNDFIGLALITFSNVPYLPFCW